MLAINNGHLQKGKPRKPGAGRKKGVPNKVNGDIKAMILEALDRKGGADYLTTQAGTNPVAFMGLVAKVLPLTVAGDPNAPLFPSKIEVRIVHPKS